MTAILELEAVPVKKANHQANIVKITEVLPHPDPETTNLELIHIDNYQVVVGKGQFKPGDLGVYIQPDSVVPQTEPFRFLWEGHLGIDGTAPEKYRRVTVRKFRKEWSEGLLLPVTDFQELSRTDLNHFVDVEVSDVSDLLGITHYNPDHTESTKGNQVGAPKRKFRYPRSFKGWFNFLRRYAWFYLTFRSPKQLTMDVSFTVPTYDIDSFKNYSNVFQPGEYVVVTEKIHGSNARFLYLDGVMYAGSRNQWKSVDSTCVWRKALKQNPWIEKWCRDHEGLALYGEVTPTQSKFDYGTDKGQVRFFLFDILDREGNWVPYSEWGTFDVLGMYTLAYPGLEAVPTLYVGPWNPEKILAQANGKSMVLGAKHIREGVVIKTYHERTHRGLGRAQLKLVSNEFLAKDSK